MSFIRIWASAKKWVLKKIYSITSFLFNHISLFYKKLDLIVNPTSNEKGYEDLTPYSNNQDQCDSTALDALEWALANKNIRNVALTGPYGSGKSTILHQLEKRNPQHKYLHISLATFRSKTIMFDHNKLELDSQNENQDSKENVLQNNESVVGKDAQSISWEDYIKQLEYSILQQIVYKEKWNKTRDSNFPKILLFNNAKKVLESLFIMIWVILLITSFFPVFVNEVVTIPDYLIGRRWVSIFLFLIFTLRIIYILIGLYSNTQLKKVKLKDGEFEWTEKNKVSILNDYLPEIIYYFEVSKCNIVFLEDLDRFQHSDIIFEKLREINILINQAKQLKGRKIIFFYATKDELFSIAENNRTKFFDFIVPIIPVIDSRNSKDVLSKKLPADEIRRDLIKIISFYIDDMRLLKNIYNEYIMFKTRSWNPEIKGFDLNQLLSIIVFKNIYPAEFSKLYSNPKDNILFKKLNSNKKNLADDLSNSIKAKISELHSLLGESRSFHIENINDLRRVHLTHFFELLPDNTSYLLIGDDIINLKAIEYLISDENFNKILDLKFKPLREESQYSDLSFIRNNFNKIIESYNGQKNLVINKESSEREQIINEIDSLSQELKQINNKSLSELSKYDSNSKIDLSKNENKLLKSLLESGYINENYERYVSFFYEGRLTLRDRNFLDCIIQHTNLPVNESLDNVKNVIAELDEIATYSREAMLNLFVLDHLLISKDEEEKLDVLMQQFNFPTDRTIQLFDCYFEKGTKRSQKKFIQKIIRHWTGSWRYITQNSNYPQDKLDKLFKYFVESGTSEDIRKIKPELSEFVNDHKNVYSLIKNIKTLGRDRSIFTLLDIRLKHLRIPTLSSQTLFEEIISNRLYEINLQNIQLLVDHYGVNADFNDLQHSNYSTIRNSECSLLIQYIRDEIEYYLENVFLKLPKNNKEDEESILELLNNKKLNEKKKDKIIEECEFEISQVDRIINYSDIGYLFHFERVVPNWNNVYSYYSRCKNKIDDVLIEFLNAPKIFKSLGNKKIDTNITNQIDLLRFKCSIIECENLTDECYTFLLRNLLGKYENLEISGLTKNKVSILIEKHFLILTSENFTLVKNKFGLQIKLIECNQMDLADLIAELPIDENDYAELLGSSKIKMKTKAAILEYIDLKIYSSDPRISKLSADIIISMPNKLNLVKEVLLQIVEAGDLESTKVKIVNNYLSDMTREDIPLFLKAIGGKFRSIVDGVHGVEINNYTENAQLITFLKRVNYISEKSGEMEKKKDKIKIWR
jgi:hypothetical protein